MRSSIRRPTLSAASAPSSSRGVHHPQLRGHKHPALQRPASHDRVPHLHVSQRDALATRTLARVSLPRAEDSIEDLVERLMGRKPEERFKFIQEHAAFAAEDLDV